MKNKVLVIDANISEAHMQKRINDELDKGWLIELFYEARAERSENKIIVTLYKEETPVG